MCQHFFVLAFLCVCCNLFRRLVEVALNYCYHFSHVQAIIADAETIKVIITATIYYVCHSTVSDSGQITTKTLQVHFNSQLVAQQPCEVLTTYLGSAYNPAQKFWWFLPSCPPPASPCPSDHITPFWVLGNQTAFMAFTLPLCNCISQQFCIKAAIT